MNFSKNIIIYGLGNGISRFLQILLVPLFVRVFSTDEYGSYDLIYTILTLAFLVGMMQLESFIARFYKDDSFKSRGVLISSTLILIVLFSAIVTLALCILSKFMAVKLGNLNLYRTIIVGALCIIPNNLFYYLTMLLRLDNKPVIFLWASILQVVINLSLSIVFVLYIKLGLPGIFWAILISNIGVSIWLFCLYFKFFKLILDRMVIKQMSLYCLPSMPSVFIGWCNNYANRFVIVYFLSKTEVGIFSAALKLSAVFIMIDLTLRMAWVPYFWTQFNSKNHIDIFQEKFKQIASVLLILILGFVFFGDPVYKIFAPRAFWEGNKIIEILGLNFFIYTLVGIISMGPDIIRKTQYRSIFSVSSLILNIVLLIFLTPRMGIVGVALALLISNIVLMTMSWAISEKLYYIGYSYKHLLLRLIPVVLFVVIFQDQNGGFLYRGMLFTPTIVIYLTIFERRNIQLIRNLLVK